MKVVILAGGFGTRLAEYTDIIPKPLVEVGGEPIIWRIVKHYLRFGYNEFIVAAGFKQFQVKQFFSQAHLFTNNVRVSNDRCEVLGLDKRFSQLKIDVIDTGELTLTGGRILRLREYIEDSSFMVTYGDGLANVNIKKLVESHLLAGRTATVTAVHPPARFGEILLDSKTNQVLKFAEKTHLKKSWINGGFFVFQQDVFAYLQDDQTILEKEPLTQLAARGQLNAFCHDGFWQCMDTKRDKEYLESLCGEHIPPWECDHECS